MVCFRVQRQWIDAYGVRPELVIFANLVKDALNLYILGTHLQQDNLF